MRRTKREVFAEQKQVSIFIAIYFLVIATVAELLIAELHRVGKVINSKLDEMEVSLG
jgi:hypothetical protein